MSEENLSHQANSKALVSMISGILGWVFFLVTLCFNLTIGALLTMVTLGIGALCFMPLGFIPIIAWVIAVTTGHIAKREIQRSNDTGRGMATAGMVMGYAGLVISLIAIITIITIVLIGGSSALPYINEFLKQLNIQFNL